MNRRIYVSFIALVACLYVCVGTEIVRADDSMTLSSSQKIRALHLVTLSSSVKNVKGLIDTAKSASFNTIILGICWRESTRLNSMPWITSPTAWSREELVSVVEYARAKGMLVIPHIPLLSHQHVLLKKPFPDLMYNGRTYDPRNDRVYEIIFPILDEIIDLLHPHAIHIGHDEVVGWTRKHYEKGILEPGETILPAQLFLYDTNKIYQYLKSRGVATWMWGDMLVSPDEFPTMWPGGLHGSADGYGADLRSRIPKDIVISDWQYDDKQKEFPSIDAFRRDGFRVLGSTWKREDTIHNFSRYAASHGAGGMVATTWYHVQNREWDVVDRIIKVSGETFAKDFPDAKQ